MNPASDQLTPDIALALATEYLKSEEQWEPPEGTSYSDFIIGKSRGVVIDLREFGSATIFAATFCELVAKVKADLNSALIASGWGATHKPVGFQFVTYRSDGRGNYAIDLGSNSFTDDANFVTMKARLFCKESK